MAHSRDMEEREIRDDRPPRITWPAVVALFSATFVLRFTYLYLDDVTRQQSGTFAMRLIEEGTGSYSALLLFPALAWVERRFPLTMRRWRRHWLPHFGALLAYSTAHTSVIALSRHFIVPALGMGAYDYGLMGWRYLMEFPSDVLSYATLVGIVTFVRVQNNLREKERREAELAREVVRARLESLTFRLQPHFLFNALNTISTTLYRDPVAADVMISNLGDLLRHALRTGEQQEVSIGEELEVLRAYLAIVDARFGDRLRCVVEAEDSVQKLAIPTLLLQPLLENAVRHGSASERSESKIVVTIRRVTNDVHIEIENDLAADGVAPRSPGTGLRTSIDRLQLLYGEAQRFSAVADGERFRVSICYPARIAPAAPPAPPPARDAHALASAHR